MYWLNMIGTVAVGAVVVLALIAVFEIVFRSPRGKHSTKGQTSMDSTPATTRNHGAARAQKLKRSESTDR